MRIRGVLQMLHRIEKELVFFNRGPQNYFWMTKPEDCPYEHAYEVDFFDHHECAKRYFEEIQGVIFSYYEPSTKYCECSWCLGVVHYFLMYDDEEEGNYICSSCYYEEIHPTPGT